MSVIDQVMSEQLGARVIGLKHWRWMAGMRTLVSWGCARLPWSPGDDVVEVAPTVVTLVSNGEPWGHIKRNDGVGGYGSLALRGHDPLPDFHDPATLGCLQALVRAEFNDPTIHAICEGGRWTVWCNGGEYSLLETGGRHSCAQSFATEAEAWVVALEKSG